MANFFHYPVLAEAFGLNGILRGVRAYPFYLRFAQVEDGSKVLDSGSGFGTVFFGAHSYKNLDPIAMDSSKRMLKYGRLVNLQWIFLAIQTEDIY